MSNIKPSTHGIVVDHKESGVRFAISDANYNPEVHRKVRDLRPGESVRSYAPRRKESLGAEESPEGKPEAASDQKVGSGDSSTDSSKTPAK